MNTSKVTTAAAAVSKADWIAVVSAVVQVVTEVTEMLHEVWTTVEAGLWNFWKKNLLFQMVLDSYSRECCSACWYSGCYCATRHFTLSSSSCPFLGIGSVLQKYILNHRFM